MQQRKLQGDAALQALEQQAKQAHLKKLLEVEKNYEVITEMIQTEKVAGIVSGTLLGVMAGINGMHDLMQMDCFGLLTKEAQAKVALTYDSIARQVSELAQFFQGDANNLTVDQKAEPQEPNKEN